MRPGSDCCSPVTRKWKSRPRYCRPVGAAALKTDLLKMPHHGSAYQDWPFLAAADPAAVFVSVGVDNEYGLPSVAALDRLAAGGARVLRTDGSGDLAAVRTATGLGVSMRGRQPGQRSP